MFWTCRYLKMKKYLYLSYLLFSPIWFSSTSCQRGGLEYYKSAYCAHLQEPVVYSGVPLLIYGKLILLSVKSIMEILMRQQTEIIICYIYSLRGSCLTDSCCRINCCFPKPSPEQLLFYDSLTAMIELGRPVKWNISQKNIRLGAVGVDYGLWSAQN